MSKKNKRSEAPDEEIAEKAVFDETPAEEIEVTAETPAEEAAANEAAAEESAASEEVSADEVNGTELSVSDTAVEADGGIGTVNRAVNFRTGPSFKNAVIVELKTGSKIALSGTVEGDKGAWYKCEFDGRTGYVKASGISVSK